MLRTTYQWVAGLTLSDWGSVASITGLAVTIWVVWTVRNIRNYYVVRTRVPDLAKRLRKHAVNLSEYLNDLPTFAHPAAAELALLEATLGSIKGKLGGDPKKTVKRLLKTVRDARSAPVLEEPTRAIYVELVKANEQIKQLQEDLTWER